MRRSKENLKDFTERALEASLTGAFIPPLVYIPATLRKRGVRIAEDDLSVTANPPTLEENKLRIAKADPVGFLIALMGGQPVPAFEVHREAGGKLEVKVDWRIADLPLRAEVAMELARRGLTKHVAQVDGFDAMIERNAVDEK